MSGSPSVGASIRVEFESTLEAQVAPSGSARPLCLEIAQEARWRAKRVGSGTARPSSRPLPIKIKAWCPSYARRCRARRCPRSQLRGGRTPPIVRGSCKESPRDLVAPASARDQAPVAGGHKLRPRPRGRLCRAQQAGRKEAQPVARPHDHQLLLRELDAHPHLVRGPPASLGRERKPQAGEAVPAGMMLPWERRR